MTNSDCIRLIDIIENPEVKSIFKSMYDDEGDLGAFIKTILKEPDIVAIDMDYLYNHSGYKKISVFLSAAMELFNGMTDDVYNRINSILEVRFLKKWQSLWDSLSFDYDPISPYDMKITEDTKETLMETSSKFDTKTHKDDNTRIVSDIDNVIDTFTGKYEGSNQETSENSKSSTNNNNVYAYNSTDATNYDEDLSAETSKDTTDGTNTRSTDESRTKKDTRDITTNDDLSHTENNHSSETINRENPINKTIERKGNIGNITRQQLINEQRELLQWQFLNVVYNDIDTVVTRGMF